ncbi:hypothetical protein Bwad002_12550 [Bilophila wadsworthia]
MHFQLASGCQVAEVFFQCIAAGSGEQVHFLEHYAAMLPNVFHYLYGQFWQSRQK